MPKRKNTRPSTNISSNIESKNLDQIDLCQQYRMLIHKFGISWPVVPTVLNELVTDPHPKKSGRSCATVLKLKKLDIVELKKHLQVKLEHPQLQNEFSLWAAILT